MAELNDLFQRNFGRSERGFYVADFWSVSVYVHESHVEYGDDWLEEQLFDDPQRRRQIAQKNFDDFHSFWKEFAIAYEDSRKKIFSQRSMLGEHFGLEFDWNGYRRDAGVTIIINELKGNFAATAMSVYGSKYSVEYFSKYRTQDPHRLLPYGDVWTPPRKIKGDVDILEKELRDTDIYRAHIQIKSNVLNEQKKELIASSAAVVSLAMSIE